MSDIPDELLAKYKEGIPNKLQSLEGLIEEYTAKKDKLRGFFHKLKGNAATYGFPKVSETCKRMQEKFDADIEISHVVEEIKKGFEDGQ